MNILHMAEDALNDYVPQEGPKKTQHGIGIKAETCQWYRTESP